MLPGHADRGMYDRVRHDTIWFFAPLAVKSHQVKESPRTCASRRSSGNQWFGVRLIVDGYGTTTHLTIGRRPAQDRFTPGRSLLDS